MMARSSNLAIVLTSCIVVTLFVLLVYPAIIPVNAPPVLKTFKDIFVALLSFTAMMVWAYVNSVNGQQVECDGTFLSEDSRSLLCTLRC